VANGSSTIRNVFRFVRLDDRNAFLTVLTAALSQALLPPRTRLPVAVGRELQHRASLKGVTLPSATTACVFHHNATIMNLHAGPSRALQTLLSLLRPSVIASRISQVLLRPINGNLARARPAQSLSSPRFLQTVAERQLTD